MVAKEALDMLRTLDSFGRVAANEFAIVMPTTWLDQSLKAIARLKNASRAATGMPSPPACR
jgi:PleD family two-component response regulator